MIQHDTVVPEVPEEDVPTIELVTKQYESATGSACPPDEDMEPKPGCYPGD